MKEDYAQEWPQFFTATIQDWKYLLKEDKYKNIIVDTLKFLIKENKVTINGFAPALVRGTRNNKIKSVTNCIFYQKY